MERRDEIDWQRNATFTAFGEQPDTALTTHSNDT